MKTLLSVKVWFLPVSDWHFCAFWNKK